MPAFIETQFPVARLSAESFRERTAKSGQTLTGLGKWWGRKPLILVRAAILGMLMPASGDPKQDRNIFLKILTMDDAAVWQRLKPNLKRKTSRLDFDRLAYAQRIAGCDRPENAGGPSNDSWSEINRHLGTEASSLQDLVKQLGMRAFGHVPRIGDSFCGGGSIPFEAARIGCEAYGTDLNPVAALLTWSSLNLTGEDLIEQEELVRGQAEALSYTDRQLTEFGIESNINGERGDAYLYCTEVKPEGCEYYIPIAPNWVVSEKDRVVAIWKRGAGDRLQVSIQELGEHDFNLFIRSSNKTITSGRILDPFDSGRTWSVEALRGPEGLRRWSNDDVVPRPGDVFQERLYCIRWVDADGRRRYAAPDAADLTRESRVLELLRERFTEWQREGVIPSKAIPEGGDETARLYRERGWTYWHHLFNPRQLLTIGTFASARRKTGGLKSIALHALTVSRFADYNSRLSCWQISISQCKNTFLNQALNTLYTYSCRGFRSLAEATCNIKASGRIPGRSRIANQDARDLSEKCDIWITDPPYADAVNYHELGDFFLAWYDKQLAKAFPEWIPDARAELAVRGDGEDFRRSMVEIYQNLAKHMPDNGMQMVMFTHQDPAVWADLGMILWAAGLRATAAWTISTETEAAGIKKGNYVQGTVCLILRKRTANEPGFLDEVYPLVDDEVKRQVASMQALDEGGEPNFNDADYQLAAYAAALKVLTQYSNLDGKDVAHEVFAVRDRNTKSDFQIVIERAMTIACDILIPRGLDASWRELSLVERYYLRALDIESRGERRKGMYEELARGFGVTDIRPLLKSDQANGTRMHTPSGFAAAGLAQVSGATADALPARRGRAATAALHPFASSPLRHLLFAIRETTATENSPEPGRQYLRDTFGQGYWSRRERFVALLEWLAALGNAEGMTEWVADSEAARILSGRLRNDHA